MGYVKHFRLSITIITDAAVKAHGKTLHVFQVYIISKLMHSIKAKKCRIETQGGEASHSEAWWEFAEIIQVGCRGE